MDEELGEVITQFGRRIVDRPEQLRAALSDVLGEGAADREAEITAVVAASQSGIAASIRDGDPVKPATTEQIQAWFDDLLARGIQLREAALATRSWATVFNANETARLTSELSEQSLGTASPTLTRTAPSRKKAPTAAPDDATVLGFTAAGGAVTERARPQEVATATPSGTLPAPPPAAQSTLLDTKSPKNAEPGSRRRLFTILGIAGGAVLLVIVAVVAVTSVQAAAHAPSVAVSAFLDELVAGNAEDAIELVDDADDSPFFDDDVYASAENTITSYKIVSTEENGSTAKVTVDVTSRGGDWTDVIELTRTGSDGPYPIWAIDGSTLPIVSAGGAVPEGLEFTIGNTDVAASDFKAGYPAFPGRYEVTQGDGMSGVYVLASQTLDVAGFDQSAKVNAAVTLTEDAVDSANAALKSYLNKCIKQKRDAPKGGCGFAVTTDRAYDTIKWKIVTRPTAEFQPFDGTGFGVTTVKTGTFKYTGDTYTSAWHYYARYTYKKWEYSGYITFGDDGKAIYTSLYGG